MEETLLKTLLTESKLRGFLRDGAIHMQVKAGSKVKNLVDYISNRIDTTFSGQIFCWALPGAIEKVVPLVEQIKAIWSPKAGSSKIYQCTRLFFHLTESKVGEYLVKANKPAMGIVLSVYELCEDPNNPPNVSVILTPGREIPAVETPFPSHRKWRHQEKKRRPDKSQCDSSSSPRKKAKHEKPPFCQQKTEKEESISDPCYRLVSAQKLSRMSVAAVVKKAKK